MTSDSQQDQPDPYATEPSEQIRKISDEFEEAWQGDTTPDLQVFLSRVPEELRSGLLLKLLDIELAHRQRMGMPTDPTAMSAAYPDIAAELDQFLSSITTKTVLNPQAQDRAKQHVHGQNAVHVRCPNCHVQLNLVVDSDFADIVCDSCGSHFSLTSDGAQTTDAETITTVGHFELIDRLGMGAFGTVWKARDTELDRAVAVKIPRRGAMDSQETEKFLREARAAAQLKHPNIVGVHEIGRDGDSLYIVSDLVRGIALDKWLGRHPLTTREAVELCVKIAKAVHHAHEQGVIHRDLKPGNIMIDGDGEPHVTDFGLARREAGEITMTIDGHILGTPAYMSPEQAAGKGHQADRRSDVYSLGVILFQMLTGELPFRGNRDVLIYQVQFDDPPSPRKFEPSLPRDLETICLNCLHKESGRRYSSAGDMADDLNRWLSDEPIRARPVSRSEKTWLWCRRNPAIAGSILTGTITIIVVAAVLYAMAQANRRARLSQAIAAMGNAREILVPYAIEDLEDFPVRWVVNVLQSQYQVADDQQKLSLAYALAEFGDVRAEYLVSQIEEASSDEVDNLVGALAHDRSRTHSVLRSVAENAEKDEDWRRKARLAIVALHVGDASIAKDMCAQRPDPVQRTCFVRVCCLWHGDLAALSRIAIDIENEYLRHSLAIAVGSISAESVNPAAKQSWQTVFTDWFRNMPDTPTHSATSWALRQWGDAALPDVVKSEDLTGDRRWYVHPIGITMLKIAPGKFRRGTGEDEGPIEHPFLIADREVTYSQFRTFLDDPDHSDAEKPERWLTADDKIVAGPDHPMQFVSWFDAVLFCNWLSKRSGLKPCYVRIGEKGDFVGQIHDMWRLNPEAGGYHLPTEHQWEYASRAGTTTRWSHGDDESVLDRYAVFRDYRAGATAEKYPNGWGLFDIHGNLGEWCHDRFDEAENPRRLAHGRILKALRGGSFAQLAPNTQTASRNLLDPDVGNSDCGFRVARTCPE